MRNNYYAYHRGKRMARNYRLKQSFKYFYNPFKHQSSEWYSFNIGWNDARFNRVIE